MNRKLQSQGVHHITIVGADRQTSIDFWEGVLGMPFIFEQPNLDNADESHLYFDPGDGRLITIFTKEDRPVDATRTPTDPGCVHHVAFALSQAMFAQAVERLDERGIRHSGVKDRGFMDSIYFQDPLGLLIELASYRFEPPQGATHADVLFNAHLIRVERGDRAIDRIHVADAIETLSAPAPDAVSVTNPLAHRRARMGGRDPHEEHRVATPLELLFDLAFVVAYGLAADELAHYLAEGHIQAGPDRLRDRRLRDHLGVDQLLVVRVRVRRRRLALPPDDDGADDRRRDPRARPAGAVRVDRRGRVRRQRA